MEYFICDKCFRKFEKNHKKGHRNGRCNSCRHLTLRNEYKKKLVELCGSKCIRCGYDKCKTALTFHHLNSKTKSFDIARGLTRRSWKSLVSEVSKCIMVCHNCHAEIHDSEGK